MSINSTVQSDSLFEPVYNPLLMTIQIVISTIGMGLNGILLVSMYKYGRSPEYLFNANILLVDFVYALALFVMAVGSMGKGASLMVAPGACEVMSSFKDGSQYSIALCFMAIAILNWNVIVRRKSDQSFKSMLRWLAAIWVVTIIAVVTYIATTTLVSAQNGIMCYPKPKIRVDIVVSPNASLQNGSNSGTNGIWLGFRGSPFILVRLLLLVVTPIVVGVAYTLIYIHVRKANKNLNITAVGAEKILTPNDECRSNTGALSENVPLVQLQHCLFVFHLQPTRFLLHVWDWLSCALRVLGMGEFGLIQTVNSQYHDGCAGHILYIFTIVSNPLVFVVCDHRIRRSLFKVVGRDLCCKDLSTSEQHRASNQSSKESKSQSEPSPRLLMPDQRPF
ncbi:hypothetical protein BSLG_001809 [Batrachochytrium salamandrivorans]|nr:hypothetical protein BSLG_001809 [Batrachochytrium salamandrivorans]